MKTATAKDLRQKTATLLSEVRRGNEVVITYRGRSIAVLAPVDKTRPKGLTAVGFGMWRGRRDMRSIGRCLRDVRAPRYDR